jgi:hypothetical protein
VKKTTWLFVSTGGARAKPFYQLFLKKIKIKNI